MKNIIAAALLLALGLLAVAGDALGVRRLEEYAAATGASPVARRLPWIDRDDLPAGEPVLIELRGRNGESRSYELGPERLATLGGPAIRRHAIERALSGAAALAATDATASSPRDAEAVRLLETVVRHALCGDSPVLRELGIEPESGPGSVAIRRDAASAAIEVRCDE